MPIEKRPVKVVAASNFYQLSSLKRHKPADTAEPLTSSQANHKQPSFNPLTAPYKTFKTQKQAYDFLDSQPCAELLRTFACEVSTTGQRVFIVTSAELFWQQYKQLPASNRHHYEIIRESSPCNLFFDLEFCPQSNPSVDGPALVKLLVCGIAEQLQQLWDIPWHGGSYVLELDSSTQQKFSRHLIIRLPGMAFADVCHAGRFARLVVLRLLQRGVHCCRHAQLLVHPKEGDGLTTFVDMGVYTRNRAFRLYLSSKYGKEACLRLTNRYGGARRCPKAAFYDLLVSVLHKRSSSRAVLTHMPAAGHDKQQQQRRRGSTRAWQHLQAACGAHAASTRPVSLLLIEQEDWQQELQQLPASWQQVSALQLNPLPHHLQLVSAHQRQQHHHRGRAAAGSSCVPWRELVASAGVHHGPTPYPLLERFIASVCVQGGVQGEVRSWMQLPGCVLFNIKHNRWCGNVERAHRSNGVYYLADLEAGVYFQKCWDPECRNYRSNCMPLPALVWQAYRPPAETPAGTATHGGAAAAAAAREAQALPVGQQPGFEQQCSGRPLPGPGSSWCSNQAGNEQQQFVSGEEDELCVQLLQQFEERQQQVNELQAAAAAGGQAVGHSSSKAGCDASWAQQQQYGAVHQQAQALTDAPAGASCGLNSSSSCSGRQHSRCVGGGGGGGAITQCGVCDAGQEEEDELCLQLLQEVEGC